MKELENSLKGFQPISLKEMDGVKLLSRIDTKFLCTQQQLAEILSELTNDYRVLEIDNRQIMSYRTTYFDTDDFKMYREHQNGKLNRYKVREREYVESDLKFLEVKFKTNKGRTIKSRVKRVLEERDFNINELDFLESKVPFSPLDLQVQLHNSYKRITLTNQIERVTIDFDMDFRCSQGNLVSVPELVIIEVKQDKFSLNSPVVSLLKNKHIRKNGFSKYCIGTMMLYQHLKSNTFKAKKQLINKLTA